MAENYNSERYTNNDDFVSAKLGINHSCNVTAESVAAGTLTGHSASDAKSKGLTPGMIGTKRTLGDREYRLVTVDVSSVAGVAGAAYGKTTSTALVATDIPVTVVGQTSIVIDTPSATKNGFAGDLFCTTDATGQGFSYKIKSNTATDSDGNCVINLLDPIASATSTDTVGIILGSVYKNVVIGGDVGEIAGVLQATIGVTAGGCYAWVQTKGMCTCISDDTTAPGMSLTAEASGFMSPHVAGDAIHGIGASVGSATVLTVVDLDIR